MTRILTVFTLLWSIGAGAQSFSEITGATTMSPLVSTAILADLGSTSFEYSVVTIIARAQHRGVAGREQMRDELPNLMVALDAGRITRIEDVEQLALREFFKEVSGDEVMMGEVNALVPEGSRLRKIAEATTFVLLMNLDR